MILKVVGHQLNQKAKSGALKDSLRSLAVFGHLDASSKCCEDFVLLVPGKERMRQEAKKLGTVIFNASSLKLPTPKVGLAKICILRPTPSVKIVDTSVLKLI